MSAIEIGRSDPISQLLRRRLKMTPGWALVALLLYAFVWRVIIPLSSRFVLTSPIHFPPSIDGLLLAFIETPMIWAYFLWSQSQIPKLFESVLKNSLLARQEDQPRFKHFLRAAELSYTARRWVLLSVIAAVVLSAIQVFQFWLGNPRVWHEPEKHIGYAILEISTYTINQYMVVMLVIRILLTTWWIRKLFSKFPISVKLDFPDKAGGWGQVGMHAAGLSSFVTAMAVWSVGFTISQNPTGIYATLPMKLAIWLLFSLLAPTAFLVPLLSTHFAMKDYKRTLLLKVSWQINRILSEAEDKWFWANEDDQASLNYKQVETLRVWYKLFEETLPEWPFSVLILRGLAPTWAMPLLTGILSTILENSIRPYFP